MHVGLQFGSQTPRKAPWSRQPTDTPINNHGSNMTFMRNRSMVLTNMDGMLVWETNTTSTGVNRIVLLNASNLVLKKKIGQIL